MAYSSDASNLVPGDTNGHQQTFSCSTGRPTPPRASPSPATALKRTAAAQARRFRRMAALWPTDSFASNLVPGDTNGWRRHLRVRPGRPTPPRASLSPATALKATAASEDPAISADGRFVAYNSNASNLVPGDTNAVVDIFLFDRQTNTTTRALCRQRRYSRKQPELFSFDFGGWPPCGLHQLGFEPGSGRYQQRL